MLEIKNIKKIYKLANFEQKALKGISVNFRENEFVAVLGPSGSGKTTLLNIIGGLDKYTSGDLVINGVSTKEYKDRDWDTYRNHRVGFVFQSYNLIPHQSVLKNVELALTLSGVSKKERIERAKEALEKVGLKAHIYKKPNQLSGGQMQRVAIARSLVNNPDILLADEPTGALDSETSVQVMDLLKEVAKDKLVIMVTHNPDLAKKYASRIVKLKDGEVISDSNPYDGKLKENNNKKDNKTSMSFMTALSLSFNNLMTKKGRTILVSLAGSIGIIGIALILALSNGFQKYVDNIGEETLTSYPLTIMNESTDIMGTLLSMRGYHEKNGREEVKEEQYITNMLSSIKANDIESFKHYLENNYDKVSDDLSAVKYTYSIDPLIYTNNNKKLSKLNPSSLFTSMYGSSSMMSSYSSFASVYNEILDNKETLNSQYELLKGSWPEEYDEMVIVLSEPNSISDLLVYSLGLRDIDELNDMVNKIMSGKEVNVKNEPLTISYDDLMNIDLRLILPTNTYKYNSKYDVYEDMSEDSNYMNKLYDNALKIKIVGIVCPKEGVNSMALNPGVAYTSKLIKYIIEESSKTDLVKKQLEYENVDVFSGKRFNSSSNKLGLNLNDIISVDKDKMKNAFNVNIDENDIKNTTNNYLNEIADSITVDVSSAKDDFDNTFNTLATNLYDYLPNNDIDTYLDNNIELINKLEANYGIPSNMFKETFKGLLSGIVQIYSLNNNMPKNAYNSALEGYLSSTPVIMVSDKFASTMTEAKMKKEILTKVGELTGNITSKMAKAYNIDQNALASAFKLNLSEDELKRVVSAMMSGKEASADTNLKLLGYQDLDNPTMISFYFNSFDSKENFLKFIDNYNDIVSEDKEIKYSDTTGILMSSVKTIVNAVSYVLIAFVSISLVVSSIMIGVITYISVYERTKEIGILRSIGASKRNISSIFNAETFIIGLLSGVLGIIITYMLIPIINMIIHHYTGNIPLSAYLEIKSAIILIILSIILTLIGGLIPAKKASTKDPVIALRTE